ncbi:MAG: hypothetical protein JRN15_06350 [Nitrososphaerota archaeon]|nr:hypothetical protein [Nitrososphaerota archaeon]
MLEKGEEIQRTKNWILLRGNGNDLAIPLDTYDKDEEGAGKDFGFTLK